MTKIKNFFLVFSGPIVGTLMWAGLLIGMNAMHGCATKPKNADYEICNTANCTSENTVIEVVK